MTSRKENWKSTIEVGSAVAVVVGLALVLYELNLSRVIARAELSSENAQLFHQILDAEKSPDFAGILLRSRVSPKELTATERLQVRAFLEMVLGLYYREKYNYDRGIFESWEEYIVLTAPKYFGYGYGHAFFETMKNNNDSDPLFESIDRAIQNTEAVQNEKDLDEQTLLKLNKRNQ